MMTRSEARQRLQVNRMVLGQRGRMYCVLYQERPEYEPYWTDDLEDAVLTGGAMRRRMDAVPVRILCDA